ncbi:MAG: hypothetical protein HQ567_18000 [Candidatus Nealsonbacteria bacterium]|nr:hypothetical protein [Candidatus Nealsonbacteria bacterium]
MSFTRRHAIGILAIVLLPAGIYLALQPIQGDGLLVGLDAACMRVGALMAVLWLAYPQIHRLPAWIWAAIPALVIVLARWPKWFFVALPIVIALVILRPRNGNRR